MSVYKEDTKCQKFSVGMCILGLFHFKNVAKTFEKYHS